MEETTMDIRTERPIVELTDAELDHVFGGAITEHHKNGGGNEPKGKANGVPTVNENPTGFEPPGQNK
jgi:hypothetical protein